MVPPHSPNKALGSKKIAKKQKSRKIALKVRFHHHIFPTNLMTNLLTKCQSEVCCKPNWFATNSLRQLCERVCHQVCCKNVMVEMHLKTHNESKTALNKWFEGFLGVLSNGEHSLAEFAC
jgi:hypothetical protein